MHSGLYVSEEALLENARTVVKEVGVPVIGVVKCDGYGVGLVRAARTWLQAGATMLAVAKAEEALELRRAGFREEILLLSPVADPETVQQLLEHDIILTVTGLENARFYLRSAAGKSVRAHLAVDTGMGRFGVKWTDRNRIKAIYSLTGIRFEGCFSHFSSAFEPVYRRTKLQLERFLHLTEWMKGEGFPIGLRHIANSCAALRFAQTRLDAVRIGGALVGVLCAPVSVRLQQAAQFRAAVVDSRCFEKGDTTGYAAVCRIRRRTRAVCVEVGFENGFGYYKRPDALGIVGKLRWWLGILRRLRRPYVIWQGKRLPLLGRIGNQYTLFDASDLEIAPGDWVEAQVPLLHQKHSIRIVEEMPAALSRSKDRPLGS